MEAKFTSMQMRSADEPLSRFYECVQCGNTWRDDSWLNFYILLLYYCYFKIKTYTFKIL